MFNSAFQVEFPRTFRKCGSMSAIGHFLCAYMRIILGLYPHMRPLKRGKEANKNNADVDYADAERTMQGM